MLDVRAPAEKAVRHIWASYWLIPTLILLASLMLAPFTLWMDHLLAGSVHSDFVLLRETQPDSAQALLSTIAASVIGVAGVSFSITMVAVSFASGSYGPRLIGNFMRDRGNQVSLGIFIGTFIYALLILREVRSADGGDGAQSITEFVPQLSISISVALAVICMFVLIYFIHHVPETINIERIIAKLGEALKTGASERFPTSYDDAPRQGVDQNWIDKVDQDDAQQIKYVTEGYIQAIDMSALRRIADKQDLLIEIAERPGGFVTTETVVLRIWADKECDGKLKKQLSSCLATGDLRTINQNIEFVADQLIEIIARALSPGMNDPYTAIACLNWLQVGILTFADVVEDEDAMELGRVYARPIAFEEFVKAVFEKVLPYIKTDVNVTAHTRKMLSLVADSVDTKKQKEVINAASRELDRLCDE